MKLLNLIVAREALQRLISLELPAATAFKIARAVRPVQAELRGYEQQRVALVRRLGKEKDGQTTVPPEKFVEFNAEHQALLDVEVELDIMPLSREILGDTKVKVADLMALQFLFENEED